MIPIEPRGQLLFPDALGYLGNACDLAKIPKPWGDAVREIQEAYIARLGPSIHSIYIRGSLPRGEISDNISDIDTFAIMNEDPPPSLGPWPDQVRTGIREKFPFVADVETHVFPLGPTLHATGFYGLRFVIKHLSACLTGENLAKEIPPFKPDLRVAFAFHGALGEEIQQTKEWLPRAGSVSQVRKGCRWIMKRIVRTGFAMLMEKEKVFTRDLYPCWDIFSKYYPERSAEMRQALEWAVNPTSRVTSIIAFLDSFGSWLSQEFRAVLGNNRRNT